MANGVDAAVATRLPFQPAGAAAMRLTQHSPASHFISAFFHYLLSGFDITRPHYKHLHANANSDFLSNPGGDLGFRCRLSPRKLL
jgi:hypothetical protein